MTRGRSWLLVPLLPFAAACGGGDSPDDAALARPEQAEQAGAVRAEVDPCALVTSAEAEQVLGAPPEAERPAEANNEYLATCRYVAPRGDGLAVLAVMVSRQNGRYGFDNARRMEEEGIRIEPVSGIGDEAFWVGDPLHTLYVLQDTTYVSIGGDVELEQARPLAVRSVERLR